MILVDDMPLEEAVFFAETVLKFPGVVDFDWDEAVALPDPWSWDWETPLRAQLRVLSGKPDVTAWTADAASRLVEVLKEPVSSHRTLLGLGEESDEQPPAVSEPVTLDAVSAEGDEENPPLS